MPSVEIVDVEELRGLLARKRVTHTEYARQCCMSRAYVSRLLVGSVAPGRRASIKLARGLVALGLERQALNV